MRAWYSWDKDKLKALCRFGGPQHAYSTPTSHPNLLVGCERCCGHGRPPATCPCLATCCRSRARPASNATPHYSEAIKQFASFGCILSKIKLLVVGENILLVVVCYYSMCPEMGSIVVVRYHSGGQTNLSVERTKVSYIHFLYPLLYRVSQQIPRLTATLRGCLEKV